MTHLSRFQRLTLLAASGALITGGALLPGTAFAAPAISAVSVALAEAEWVEATDEPSGISAQLPGEAELEETQEGDNLIRTYTVETEYGETGFTVQEIPGSDPSQPWDLVGTLNKEWEGWTVDDGTQTGTTEGGVPFLSATARHADGQAAHVTYFDLGTYLLTVTTVGGDDQEAAIDQDNQQVVDSILVPQEDGAQDTAT